MVIPEKMKLNKFQHVAIPANSDYFQRFGKVTPLDCEYSGESYVSDMQSKLEQIQQADKEYRDQLPRSQSSK